MITTYDLISAHPFLAGMSARWLDLLAYRASRSVRLPGHRLFREGAPADRFWLIRQGRVALDLPVPGRGDVVVETLGPDTVVGWSWLFPPYRWHFGAVVMEETLTIQFDAPRVRQLCDNEPALGYELSKRFMAVMLDRLQATRIRLLDLYGPPVESPQPS
jgi:CRP-like cAMP-binding protein